MGSVKVSDLPLEWVLIDLASIVEIIRGITYSKSQSSPLPQDDYLPILRANNIQNQKLIFDELVHIEKSLVKEQQKIRKNDILVAMSSGSKALVGKSAQSLENFEFGFGAFCAVLRPIDYVNPNFIGYFTYSENYRTKISELSAGANINNLKPSHFSEIFLGLPPKAEQEKIAELLDNHLAQVEAIKARLNAIPQILKKFRQSVLADAVSGRLIGLEKKFQDLETIKFENLILKSGNGIAKRSGTDGKDITVLRLADFKNSERMTGNERQITLTEKEINQYQLNQNDILVVRVNGSIDLAGKFILYEQNKNIEAYCDHFIRFQLNQEKILPQFMIYIANFGKGRDYLQNSLSTSAGQNTINQTSIKNLTLKLPSIGEQREIVKRVEQLFAFADTIETQITNALQRVNQLTQSILHQAFTGQLTADWRANHPELIIGDNSAEKLLEQIQKQKATPTKKIKKVKNAT